MNDFTSRRISSSQLLCVTPNFTDIFSGSRLYSVTLSFVSDLTVTHRVFSPLLSSWSNIRTTSDSFIRVYAIGSTIPTINPDACEENGSCDLCGICIHNSTQEESNQCVGVDGVVYGQPKNECSIDEVQLSSSLKFRFVIRMVFVVSLSILIVKGHVMELWWLGTVGILFLTFVVLVKYLCF